MQVDLNKKPLPPGVPNLTPYERAARIFCAKSGLNADATVQLEHPTFLGTTVEVKQWELVAERMYDLSLLMTSMRDAAVEDQKLEGPAANQGGMPS
jgi:hypothetical protein